MIEKGQESKRKKATSLLKLGVHLGQILTNPWFIEQRRKGMLILGQKMEIIQSLFAQVSLYVYVALCVCSLYTVYKRSPAPNYAVDLVSIFQNVLKIHIVQLYDSLWSASIHVHRVFLVLPPFQLMYVMLGTVVFDFYHNHSRKSWNYLTYAHSENGGWVGA